MPPFSFWVLARSPGALRRNLVWLTAIGVAVAVMVAITGDAVQWIAYGFAAYAVASWAQHLRRADPAALADAGIRSVAAIGDCLAPGLLAAAVYGGHKYARELDAAIPVDEPAPAGQPRLPPVAAH